MFRKLLYGFIGIRWGDVVQFGLWLFCSFTLLAQLPLVEFDGIACGVTFNFVLGFVRQRWEQTNREAKANKKIEGNRRCRRGWKSPLSSEKEEGEI